MMYYKLTDILVFLEECKYEKYLPIEDVIDTLNDYHLSESEKIKYVLAIFKYHGLNATVVKVEPGDEILFELPIFHDTINPIQLFDVTFTNGKIDFWQNLN